MISITSSRVKKALFRLNYKDYFFVIALIAITIAYILIASNLAQVPFEDAAITMRYAKNLSNGYGMVWNIGEKPVDGATNFLFALVLAFLHKIGITLEAGARLIGFLSHFATIILLYFIFSKLLNLHRFLSFLLSAFFAIGPSTKLIAAYFGTPFFVLFVCLSWFFVLKMTVKHQLLYRNAYGFAFSSLIMSLIRPEGVFWLYFLFYQLFMLTGLKDQEVY